MCFLGDIKLYTEWFNIAFDKFKDMLRDYKQVKNVNTHWSGNFGFDLQLFEIDVLQISGLNIPRIYVDMTTLDVAVFRTQIVRGQYFFAVIARGLLKYAKKVIPTQLSSSYINMTLETDHC
jgi:hypothetical protein